VIGHRYDLIVIGSGPAGEKAALLAALENRRVALIEAADSIGGSAANIGSLPSKTLREAILNMAHLRRRGFRPADSEEDAMVVLSDYVHQKNKIRDSERQRIMVNLETHDVTRFRGMASFTDAHTIHIIDGGQKAQIEGDVILIATGSHPSHPDIFPFSELNVYDSDSILENPQIPSSLAIIGGGVIGVEYACMFASLGTSVTLIHGSDSLLPFLDKEISAILEENLGAMGVNLRFGEKVTKFRTRTKIPPLMQMQLDSNHILEAESVLVTAGRRGNTEALNLSAAGLQPDDKGLIPVNSFGQTSVPHIYAAGDVIGFPALASTSMEQGRRAVAHAFELGKVSADSGLMPLGIYTIPEISMVGWTEERCQSEGVPYVTGSARYNNCARGNIIGDDLGCLKLIFRQDSGKLIGVHVVGDQATELVHIGLLAMATGSGAELLSQTCFNYPTLSEMYRIAAQQALVKLSQIKMS